MVADIWFIWQIRRIRWIMFSGKLEESLDVHQRHKVADIADGCGYSVHPADPADHVFRKYRIMFRVQRHKVA